jgi:hypothetical protein
MRYGAVDGSAFSFMTGCGEAYFAAFALALGLGELAAGLIGPVPQLIAACSMLFAHAFIIRLGSLKKWVVLLASIQASVFAPLTAIAVLGAAPAWLVYACVSLYWIGSIGGGAAWNAWATAMYPAAIRPRYFGRRTRLQQFFVLVGLVSGGAILQSIGSGNPGPGTAAYAILFAASGLARALSVAMLTRHSDPVPIPPGFRDVRLPEFAAGLRNHRGGKLLLAMVCLQATAMVAGPFFAPYMLAQLDLEYAEYMGVVGTMVLAKSLALPTIGELIKRIGARPVLLLGGFGIVPLSAMWVVSDHIAYLLLCQIISGVCWAAYELASFLLLFDTIPIRERVGLLARYNLVNTLASALGAAAGGALLGSLGTDANAYLTVFAVSSGLRLLAAPLLLRVERGEPSATDIPVRPISVGAGAASMDRPVLAGLDDTEPSEQPAESSPV